MCEGRNFFSSVDKKRLEIVFILPKKSTLQKRENKNDKEKGVLFWMGQQCCLKQERKELNPNLGQMFGSEEHVPDEDPETPSPQSRLSCPDRPVCNRDIFNRRDESSDESSDESADESADGVYTVPIARELFPVGEYVDDGLDELEEEDQIMFVD